MKAVQGGQRIAIDGIYAGAGPAGYRDPGCPDALLESLRRLGQIQPLLVAPRRHGLTLVCGHRRAAGLSSLECDEVWIHWIEAPSDLDILRISVMDNRACGGFTDLERARIVHALKERHGCADSDIAEEWLPLLGLERSQKLVVLYHRLGSEPSIHPGIRSGTMTPGLAGLMLHLFPGDIDFLLAVLDESRLGYSRSRELLHLIDELARRDNLPVERIVGSKRGIALMEELRTQRFPSHRGRRERLCALNRDLPGWLRFEETSREGLELRLRFSGTQELGTRIEELNGQLEGGDTQDVLDLF